jgi:2'-5' RNA ligase
MIKRRFGTMPEIIRSFIAFDLNNESVLKRFEEVQQRLIETGAALKLVKPQNIHITMRFLGDMPVNMVDRINEAMNKVSFMTFECEIRGVGAFPNVRNVRVVWAGIRKGANELRNVLEQLEPNLRQLGFTPDPKGFSAHLTLARVKTGHNKAQLSNSIQELTDYNFGVVKANCLRLKKSVLTPKGPIYSTLIEVCH